MTGAEQGFLLLTSSLGDPERRILTVAQTRQLRQAVSGKKPDDPDRDLLLKDLLDLGYSREMGGRILSLLGEGERLAWYLHRGEKKCCIPLTPASSNYPKNLYSVLGGECPGCLWAKGDLSLLQLPAISLVGSRELLPENKAFAREVGKQAALQGYVLISGNARGADQCAQQSCLDHGGRVVSIVADALEDTKLQENVLYLSEDSFDLPFSASRALSRNRLIHAMGQKVFVAQSGYYTGGTWDGTVKNLKKASRPVFVFEDGSQAALELIRLGATPVNMPQLKCIDTLTGDTENLFYRM